MARREPRKRPAPGPSIWAGEHSDPVRPYHANGGLPPRAAPASAVGCRHAAVRTGVSSFGSSPSPGQFVFLYDEPTLAALAPAFNSEWLPAHAASVPPEADGSVADLNASSLRGSSPGSEVVPVFDRWGLCAYAFPRCRLRGTEQSGQGLVEARAAPVGRATKTRTGWPSAREHPRRRSSFPLGVAVVARIGEFAARLPRARALDHYFRPTCALTERVQ
jgi:hypothetical protein